MFFGQATAQEIMELQKALKKSADVGYQTPAGTSGGDAGNLSPLVAQSIENTLTTLTFDETDAVLWEDIPKVDAKQTLHEYAKIVSHGQQDLDPFFSEGGLPGTNQSEYARDSVKIRFLGERRQVTDVGTITGLMGPRPEALANETYEGTVSLIQKLEYAMWHADNALNDNQFDGVIKQIRSGAPSNVENLNGGLINATKLLQVVGRLSGHPNWARIDTIYMEPRYHQELINQTTNFGRHDQLAINQNTSMMYGIEGLKIRSPRGIATVKSAAFLADHYYAPSASFGDADGTPDATPVVAGVAAVNASSLFGASDAGQYVYRVVAVGDKGYSAPGNTAAIAVSAGEAVTLTITAPADAKVKYYKIYRADPGVATADAVMIGRVVKNGVLDTTYVDLNTQRPNNGKIVFAQNNKRVWAFARMLDMIRRPLAEVTTAYPFLLMIFGAMMVKAPSKMYVLENVGLEEA